MPFFGMLFQTLFLSLRTPFWSFWAPILDHFGYFFLAFSYLGSFLKIVLPCRRELKIQGPGVIEIAKKNQIKTALDCGVVVGSHFLRKICDFCEKVAPKWTPNWNLSWPRGVTGTTHFHPWVHKVAQVVPNGAQSGSKDALRLPKWS